MNKTISFVCPTYRRAKLQTRMTDSIFNNAKNPEDVEVVFGIDNDDEIALSTYEKLKEKYGEDRIKVCLIEPGENLPNISNICAIQKATGDIIGNIADDVEIESRDWDVTVREEFSKFDDGILLLWSDDGLWGGKLASHYFIHRNWVKVLGHVQPTHFHADWTDHWNQKLAHKLGRGRVILDRKRLFLHHKHAELGGMDKDETYWHVKAKRERNVAEGLNFDGNAIPPKLIKLHDEEYEKLRSFIMQNSINKFEGEWHGGIVAKLEEEFLAECLRISSHKNLFMNFKRNGSFCKVIGNDIRSKPISDKWYEYLENTDLLKNIKKYKTNDIIGNPLLYNYEKTGMISPGTLCFLSVLNDINTRLVDIKDKKVCEIGSGYGGQAKIFLDYGVESMDIIDRKETLTLASKYLGVFKYNNLTCHTTDNVKVKNYDVVVSNWCLSELDKTGMKFYIDNVISRSKHAYFLTNFRGGDREDWLKENLSKIFDSVTVEEELPKTNEIQNYVFLCKDNKLL